MIIESQFSPPWWLRNPHLQTLLPLLLKRRSELPLERERLELPDGDFLDLVATSAVGDTVVLILHGLEGSLDSHYVPGLLDTCHAQGWRGVLMHFRGCSGEPNRLARRYHSGETGDIAFVVDVLRRRYPWARLCAVGVSLGGNALLKWLGETGVTNPLSAAVAVSVPFRLQAAVARLERGLSRIYQYYLLQQLKRAVARKYRARKAGEFDLEAALAARTLREFDDCVTAPLHGFRDAEHYYAQSSCAHFLTGIHVPTLILHARDDPFLSAAAIPQTPALSPCVTLELSYYGGHVGFLENDKSLKLRRYYERRIVDVLREDKGGEL